MKLFDYLKYAIGERCYMRKHWIISCFAITITSEEDKKNPYPGMIVREPFGIFFQNSLGELEKLEIETKKDEPILRPSDRIKIDSTWISSVKSGEVETSMGTLLVNLVCIHYAFGNKVPYKTGKLSVRDLEKEFSKVLESVPAENEPRLDTVLYVDENLRFSNGVIFLESLSQIFTHSITRKGILPAPGRIKFRDELIKKHGAENLSNPVTMAKFEKDLQAYDDAYLKDDPAYGKFMSGKVAKSRMKLFMTQGGESNGFTGSMKVTPIVNSLEEGIPLDQDGFTAIANTIRYGSFARGSETVNGGVTAKALMRAADNWRITKGDCGTPFGIAQMYREKEVDKLIGRYVIEKGQPVLINTIEEAKVYASRKILVRSPQYCSREGTQTCEVCAGLALAKYQEGLPIPLMEVSGGILTDSLKLMHNTALTTEEVDLPSVIT